MTEKTMLAITEARARVTGELSQIALEYAAIYGQVVPLAREAGFGEAELLPDPR